MVQLVLLGLAALIYAEVVRQDIGSRKIPNALSAAAAILACLRWTIAGDMVAVQWTFAVAALLLLVLLVLFARGWLGGGDVKLMVASILLVGYRDAATFLLVMAIAGGVLSLLVVLWPLLRRRRSQMNVPPEDMPAENLPAAQMSAERRPATVPYGVAIAFAATLVLVQQYRQG